jgi:hypothetical protein
MSLVPEPPQAAVNNNAEAPTTAKTAFLAREPLCTRESRTLVDLSPQAVVSIGRAPRSSWFLTGLTRPRSDVQLATSTPEDIQSFLTEERF